MDIAKSIVVGMGVGVIVRKRLCDKGDRTSSKVDSDFTEVQVKESRERALGNMTVEGIRS